MSAEQLHAERSVPITLDEPRSRQGLKRRLLGLNQMLSFTSDPNEERSILRQILVLTILLSALGGCTKAVGLW